MVTSCLTTGRRTTAQHRTSSASAATRCATQGRAGWALGLRGTRPGGGEGRHWARAKQQQQHQEQQGAIATAVHVIATRMLSRALAARARARAPTAGSLVALSPWWFSTLVHYPLPPAALPLRCDLQPPLAVRLLGRSRSRPLSQRCPSLTLPRKWAARSSYRRTAAPSCCASWTHGTLTGRCRARPSRECAFLRVRAFEFRVGRAGSGDLGTCCL